MDANTEAQARATLKKQLESCTENQLDQIRIIFCVGKYKPTIDDLVQSIPLSRIHWVISQTEPSLNA